MRRSFLSHLLVLALIPYFGACGGSEAPEIGSLSGEVRSDGSSTVQPIAEAVAEEFQIANPSVRVTVGVSGTGGGFQRFCSGETDLSNASRAINDVERALCEENGVDFLELPIAWDGITLVGNESTSDFLTCLTVEEARRLWTAGSQITRWNEVRPSFPSREISLYGAGTSSGTFDYFTLKINGETGRSRTDYQAFEDDNMIVQGVVGDVNALGYFGYAYYLRNRDRLNALEVDAGNGCVLPSRETIRDGSYFPLTRPLFVYARRDAVARPEVRRYLEFMMNEAESLVPATGYHALDSQEYQDALEEIARAAGA